MTNKTVRHAKALVQICTLLVSGYGTTAVAQTLNVPAGSVAPTANFSTNESLPAFATVQFTNLPSGFDVNNQTYLAWCADFNQNILVYPTSTPDVYNESTGFYTFENTSATLGFPTSTSNWPEVDWLLNNKTGQTCGQVNAGVTDIQEAIWYLLEGSYNTDGPFTGAFDPSNPSLAAQELVSQAQMYGKNFVAQPGQTVAVLLNGVSQSGNPGVPQSLIIETKVPGHAACTIPSSGTNMNPIYWNNFNIPYGTSSVVWVHAQFTQMQGIPTNTKSTVTFSNVSFVLSGTSYPMPNGVITFDPSAPGTSSTVYNASTNTWNTTMNPWNIGDENFFTGVAIPITSAIASGGQATINFTTSSSVAPMTFSWQWSAAAYSYWPGAPGAIPANYNSANIQSYHGYGFSGSQHADTPCNTQVQQCLTQGPRGGGSSGFTGSWSGSGQGCWCH